MGTEKKGGFHDPSQLPLSKFVLKRSGVVKTNKACAPCVSWVCLPNKEMPLPKKTIYRKPVGLPVGSV